MVFPLPSPSRYCVRLHRVALFQFFGIRELDSFYLIKISHVSMFLPMYQKQSEVSKHEYRARFEKRQEYTITVRYMTRKTFGTRLLSMSRNTNGSCTHFAGWYCFRNYGSYSSGMPTEHNSSKLRSQIRNRIQAHI
jgi:hypothetical protein